MKVTIIAVLLLTMSGCAMLDQAQTKGAREVAKAIIKYCQSTDAYFREDFRAKINEELEPHGISERVYCKGED